MVQFKLQHRGLVRKVTFKNVDQPSWHELSWKIGDVCNIPHAAVALTYLDPDGDKITISSQAELKEYYSSLDEDDLDSNVPHKFIVRNLNDGIPDPNAVDPSEDNFLMRDARTMAASTVGGGSQWGFNPEDEAERDPTKLRLSGYSTFADALSPLAGSATEPDDDRDYKEDKEDLPGGFNAKPQTQESPPAAKSSGWGLPIPGFWGKSSTTTTAPPAQPATQPAPSPPPPAADSKSNPWASDNIEMTSKAPAWGANATSPTSGKAPATPWGAPASVATGNIRSSFLGKGAAPAPSTTDASARNPSGTSTIRPNTVIPPPVPPIVQMDSMFGDRASSYAASPALTSMPKSGKKGKKKMTHQEREAERQREEAIRIEEQEQKAMEREAERERQENARYSAEAAARAAAEETRRVAERELEWERERERLKAEEEQRRREPPRHMHQKSDASSDWQHIQQHKDEQVEEDEEAYRARIEAARANVFGTDPSPTQPQPQPRQRKPSTKSKGEKSTGKSSRPNSKVYPPTPAPKKFFEPDLVSEHGQSSLHIPNGSNYAPTTPGHSVPATPARPADSTAQVCNDVADLLGSFKRILDSEPDLVDAIREAFAHGPAAGALTATFGNRNLSPEMLRIVSSVDDLLTKILPNRPPPSPYVPNNMELEPRVPTPSVTPTPVIPAEPEFGVPPSEYGSSFEYANRGRQGGVPVINVPRPKYPASSLTREGYSTGTTPPATSSGYGYAKSGTSPDRSARARSRSRPPPGDFEIVPPSQVPHQARMVIPPPVVPGEETDESPITPGFTRQGSHEGGLVLANPNSNNPAGAAKADMENARQHYKSQRELYKLEKAERKKEMEERAAAKAERRRMKAAANADPNITDLKNQLGSIVPPRPYEAERQYIENPYENPRSAALYSNPHSERSSTVYAEGLGQVTLMPVFPGSGPSAVTAPVSPVREDSTTPGFERARRRRQSLNASPERFHPPPSTASRTESYHRMQPDAYGGAAHHAPPYAPAQPPQQDLAKRVALRLTEMGYTPQKYPSLPAIVGHRIRPIMNTHGVNENELAYVIIQDLFQYSGQN